MDTTYQFVNLSFSINQIEEEEQVNPKKKVTEKGLLMNGQPLPVDLLLSRNPSALRRVIWPRV